LTSVGYDSGRYNNWGYRTQISPYSTTDTQFINNISTTQSFDQTAVAANQWTIPSHGFGATNDYVHLRYNITSGTTIGAGYIDNNIYLFKVINANTLEATVTVTGTGTYTLTKDVDRTNSTSLGYNAVAEKANQVMLGDTNVTEVKTYGVYEGSGGRFGDVSGGDYTEIEADGTIISHGTANAYGTTAKASATDAGYTGEKSLYNGEMYECVIGGTAGNATWVKYTATTV
jgi:hypothetical protein